MKTKQNGERLGLPFKPPSPGPSVTESGVWLLAAQKPILKRQGWWKGEFALFQRPATWGEGRLMSKGRLPLDKQWVRAFKGEFQGRIDRGRELRAGRAQAALTGILKLIIGGLTNQRPLDCFRYRSSSVPGSVCSHFFAASSQNCGSLCHGYSLVIM